MADVSRHKMAEPWRCAYKKGSYRYLRFTSYPNNTIGPFHNLRSSYTFNSPISIPPFYIFLLISIPLLCSNYLLPHHILRALKALKLAEVVSLAFLWSNNLSLRIHLDVFLARLSPEAVPPDRSFSNSSSNHDFSGRLLVHNVHELGHRCSAPSLLCRLL